MTLYKWSQIAANDAGVDGTINWAEGQSPSSINDSARAMMAAISKYRDDQAGSLILVNSGTAYTVSSNQGFDTLAHLDKQAITFVAAFTNGVGATLNVDGLGAFPLVTANGTPVPAGAVVATAIYSATFYNSFSEFRLHAFYNNSTFNIPLGGLMDYICPAVPNSSFIFPVGQPISRVTYATLFAAVGTTYGVGDGTNTFNVPDLTGRVTAMKEASGTRLTTAGSGVDGGTLGSAGGVQNVVNSLLQIPGGITSANAGQSITVATAGGNTIPVTPNSISSVSAGGASGIVPTSGSTWSGITALTTVNSISVTASNTGASGIGTGAAAAHNNVQPTFIVNKILRII